MDLMERIRLKLSAIQVVDLNLRGSHILLSRRVDSKELVLDDDGQPEFRICTFQLLSTTDGWSDPVGPLQPS
jgi:hypothetical protein